MRVIPAIDCINGKVVRLSQGDFDQVTNYALDPVEQALNFEQQGFTHLHLVDLEGARMGKVQQTAILLEIKRRTSLIIDFGGGIKSTEDLEKVFSSGAEKVNIGSLAITQPEIFSNWLTTYGGDRFILSADVRDGFIFIDGWKRNSGKILEEVITQFSQEGLKTVTCTDISKDGMLSGPAVNFYRGLKKSFPDLEIIASGGVSSVADLVDLKKSGCTAAIAGKSLLEGRISTEDLIKNNLAL
ncbi:MAG: HisA/HisF-related TIM barrel protein [Cyclobacteriaceae bacterium]